MYSRTLKLALSARSSVIFKVFFSLFSQRITANFRPSSTRCSIVQVLTVAIGGDDLKASIKCLG